MPWPVLDNFNHDASTNLTSVAGWATVPTYSSEPTLAINSVPDAAVVPAISTWYSNHWNTSSADQESWVEVAALGAGAHSISVDVRINSPGASPTYYGIEINLVNGAWTLWEYTAGSGVYLDENETGTAHVGGNAWGLRVVGSTFTVWKRLSGVWTQQNFWNGGSPQLTKTDASITSGKPGFQANFATSIKINEFGGGEEVAVATAQPSRRSAIRRA